MNEIQYLKLEEGFWKDRYGVVWFITPSNYYSTWPWEGVSVDSKHIIRHWNNKGFHTNKVQHCDEIASKDLWSESDIAEHLPKERFPEYYL